MSDYSLDAPSELAAPSGLLAPDPMSVDASAIDKNLRAIQQVESGWRFPALPDEVRLDLATLPGMDHRSISRFLYGAEADAFQENDQRFNSDPLTPNPSVVSATGDFGPVATTGFQDAMGVLNSLRGLPAPKALDGDAVQRWKLKAIDEGYLAAPENGVVDGSWSPELSALQRQQQYDEFDKFRGGEGRVGAIGFGKAMDMLNDWTSPSGLMRAATELDLFWDVGQIDKEWSSWGDKWRKLGDSKDPLDFVGNLFDAMTGPIDDIVVPALNIALLFAGVGAAANFGRLAITGTRVTEAAESLGMLSKMYDVPGIGSFLGKAMPLADGAALDGLGEASWLSRKLMGKAGSIGLPFEQGGGRVGLGRAMAGWRNSERVIGVRGLTQTGMRLGFVSQVENRLLPNYKGSALSDIPAVASLGEKAQASQWMMPFEILFTPYAMFAPGTFTGGGRSAVQAAWRHLGTPVGRSFAGGVLGAAGGSLFGDDGGDVLEGAAIGAGALLAAPAFGRLLRSAEDVKWMQFGGHNVPILSQTRDAVIGFGKALSHLSFTPIGQDQRIASTWMTAIKNKLPAEEWANFQQSAHKEGFLQAWASRTGLDKEAAAANITFVTIAAAIDRTAALQAGLGKSELSLFHMWLARNKLTAQLRQVPDDISAPALAELLAQRQGGRQNIVARTKAILADINKDPTGIAEIVAQHNQQARLTMRQLLSPENLPIQGHGFTDDSLAAFRGLSVPGGRVDAEEHYAELTKYIGSTLDSFGDWTKYQPLTNDLHTMSGEGLFDDAQLLAAKSMIGQGGKMDMMPYLPQYRPPIDESMLNNWSSHAADIMSLAGDRPFDMVAWRKAGGYFNPLTIEVDAARGAMALARQATAVKQDYMTAADELYRVVAVFGPNGALYRAGKVMRQAGPDLAGNMQPVRVLDELQLGTITSKALGKSLQALAVGEKDRKAIERVRQMFVHMNSRGVDTSRGIEAGMREFLTGLEEDARWTRLKQPSRITDENDKVLQGLDALKARAKRLRRDAVHVAAEVDKEHLLESLARKHSAPSSSSTAKTAVVGQLDMANISRAELDSHIADLGLTAEEQSLLRWHHKYVSTDPADAAIAPFPGKFRKSLADAVQAGEMDAAEMESVWKDYLAVRNIRATPPASVATPNYGSSEYLKMKAYFDHVESQGYKVVHGSDFLMPDDLLHTSGIFRDINERHMNAMTLGNFFGRKHPAELALNVQMSRQRSIAKSLSRALGEDLAPDDDRVLLALDDLYKNVLTPELNANKVRVAGLHNDGLLAKPGHAIVLSGRPMSLADLGLNRSQKTVVEALAKQGWSKTESHAIWQGLKEARHSEWSDMGLAAIEAKLRGRSQFIDALHVLGSTSNGTALKGSTIAKRAVIGANVGVAGAVGSEVLGDGLDTGDLTKIGAAGLIGAATGPARGLVGAALQPVENAIDFTKWARYGYMADGLAAFRDRMRFSLSPFFDISRYTEAHMLNQIAAPKRLEDGTRLALPLNQSPKTLRKRLMKSMPADFRGTPELYATGKMNEIETAMKDAARGQFDPTDGESTSRWFESIGVAGFNPTAWMQSTFHYLKTEAGMGNEQAWHTVRDMYTYGTKARSGIEQSTNFIFFPFSFLKKTGTHMASYIADDLQRAVILHDTYKMYEMLDEKYDLGAWVDDHAPVLRKLQQLNMFAYGISPGKFGGVNAPFIQTLFGDPTSPDAEKKGLILNLFSPQGMQVGTSLETLKDTFTRTIPAINDINWMMEDLKQQGHVLRDGTWQTERAQARTAYADWTEYRKGVDAALKNIGASWFDLRTNPGLRPLYDNMQKHKLDLQNKYPGWNEQKIRGVENQARLQIEAEMHQNMVLYRPDEATLADRQFVQFSQILEAQIQIMAQYGFEDTEDMPPAEYDRIRNIAIKMAQGNPAFLMLYRKFWEKTYGLIETPVLP